MCLKFMYVLAWAGWQMAFLVVYAFDALHFGLIVQSIAAQSQK